MEFARRTLCQLTGASQVQILPGSGSLGNAVVAAQLGLHPATGLVLANGEFGERLVNDARRAQLRFDALRLPWGEAFDFAQVNRLAARLPRGGWLWCVHHETSTGMLNPLDELKSVAARHGLRLCLDCVSSLGAVPVDLSHVHLASGTSGKGLGAFPGLALVFHNYEPVPEPDRLPGYLDLGHWATHGSVPHTHSSNLVAALGAALRQATPARMERIRANAAWLRATLRAEGCTLATPDALACPGLITLVLDRDLAVAAVGEELEKRGFLLSFRSSHLLARNWLQISLLGDPPRAALESLLPAFHALGVGRPAVAAELQPA
jgi:aspartate aminotransferase-like enzyme